MPLIVGEEQTVKKGIARLQDFKPSKSICAELADSTNALAPQWQAADSNDGGFEL